MDNSFDEILREANQTFRVTGNEFLCSFEDTKGLELMKIDLTKAGNNLFISFNPVKHTSQPMNIVNDIANNGRPFKMDFSVVRMLFLGTKVNESVKNAIKSISETTKCLDIYYGSWPGKLIQLLAIDSTITTIWYHWLQKLLSLYMERVTTSVIPMTSLLDKILLLNYTELSSRYNSLTPVIAIKSFANIDQFEAKMVLSNLIGSDESLRLALSSNDMMTYKDYQFLYYSYIVAVERLDIKHLYIKSSNSCWSKRNHSLNYNAFPKSRNTSRRFTTVSKLFSSSSPSYNRTPSLFVDPMEDLVEMSLSSFACFLNLSQSFALTLQEVEEIILQYDFCVSSCSQIDSISLKGFAHYLLSNETVYPSQDMTKPLSSYFIASSHNTYLTSYQVFGGTSTLMYAKVLLSGCRCVELDCYDGTNDEPVICHGDVSTRIFFQDVIHIISTYAFITSPYPLILSIENHCSISQQIKMAFYFKNILGDLLLSDFITDDDIDSLPSPEELKHKILIKNKKRIVTDEPQTPPLSASSTFPMSATPTSRRNSGVFDFPFLKQVHKRDSTQSLHPLVNPRPAPSSLKSLRSTPTIYRRSFSDISFNLTVPPTNRCSLSLDRNVSSRRLHNLHTSYTSASSLTYTDVFCKENSTSQIDDIEDVSFSSNSDLSLASSPYRVRQISTKDSTDDMMSIDVQSSDGKGSVGSGIQFRRKGLDRSVMSITTQSVVEQGSSLELIADGEEDRYDEIKGATPNNRFIIAPPKGSPRCKCQITGFLTRKKGRPRIAKEMSDLVIYTEPLKFKGFKDANKVASKCTKMYSFNESTATKTIKKTPSQLLSFTDTNLIRVYPDPSNINSANFNPALYWMHGCQMVALNYQKNDKWLQYYTTFFEQANRCGYVLKSMCSDSGSAELKITVISLQYHSLLMSYLPTLEIELLGNPKDCDSVKTQSYKIEGKCAVWADNSSFTFKLVNPSFLAIRFMIKPEPNSSVYRQCVMYNTLLVGYQHIYFTDTISNSLTPVSLFINVEKTDITIDSEDDSSNEDTVPSKPKTLHTEVHCRIPNITTTSNVIKLLVSTDITSSDILHASVAQFKLTDIYREEEMEQEEENLKHYQLFLAEKDTLNNKIIKTQPLNDDELIHPLLTAPEVCLELSTRVAVELATCPSEPVKEIKLKHNTEVSIRSRKISVGEKCIGKPQLGRETSVMTSLPALNYGRQKAATSSYTSSPSSSLTKKSQYSWKSSKLAHHDSVRVASSKRKSTRHKPFNSNSFSEMPSKKVDQETGRGSITGFTDKLRKKLFGERRVQSVPSSLTPMEEDLGLVKQKKRNRQSDKVFMPSQDNSLFADSTVASHQPTD